MVLLQWPQPSDCALRHVPGLVVHSKLGEQAVSPPSFAGCQHGCCLGALLCDSDHRTSSASDQGASESGGFVQDRKQSCAL